MFTSKLIRGQGGGNVFNHGDRVLCFSTREESGISYFQQVLFYLAGRRWPHGLDHILICIYNLFGEKACIAKMCYGEIRDADKG